MQIVKILRRNEKIDGQIKRVLQKFSDWEINGFSVDYTDSGDYTINLYLGKTIAYPKGDEMQYKALFGKIEFETFSDKLVVRYQVYHYEKFEEIILEENEFEENLNDIITLWLLKIINGLLTKNIKYLRSRLTQ